MLPGIDRASVREVSASLCHFGDRYVTKVFAGGERSRAAALPEAERAPFLTGCFAAKEAVYKALRIPADWPVPWTDIEIGPTRWPHVELHGRARDWATRMGVSRIDISIAQTQEYAVASAIVADLVATGDAGREHSEEQEDGEEVSEQIIREILAQNAQLHEDAKTIATDANLFDAGMTSHASVNVMLALEDEFEIEFPDEMLTGDHFNSINHIRAALVKLGVG